MSRAAVAQVSFTRGSSIRCHFWRWWLKYSFAQVAQILVSTWLRFSLTFTKVLSGKDLTHNAKEYFTKTVLSLSLAYPYLVTMLDEYIFHKYCAGCSSHQCIHIFAENALKAGISRRNYEQAAYAIFFAIKYRFQLENFDVSSAIESSDSVFMLMAFYYAQKEGLTNEVKQLKATARQLAKDLPTFDEPWIYLYEILPKSCLKAEWVKLTENRVSFVKPLTDW